MKGMIAKSLAGTNETYVLVQVRLTDHNTIKVQGLGPSGNRPYGFTEEFPVDKAPELAEFIESVGKQF